MKIISKIKKIIFSAGIAIMALLRNVYAVDIAFSELYGVEDPDETISVLTVILNIVRFIIIPIVLLIGLIIYWKKGKDSNKVKFIGSIVAIVITLAFVGLITFIANIFI